MDKKVKDILDLIAEDKELIKTRQICSEEKIPLNITGLCEQQKSYIASALSSMEGKKPVIVVPDFPAARELSTALSAFTDDEIIILRPSEMSLVSAVASSRDNDFDRTGTIERIIRSDFGAAIICAGLAKVNPIEVSKRNALPCLAAAIVLMILL